MKNIIIVVFTTLYLIFTTAAGVNAVTKTSGNLRLTIDEPLFSSVTTWYPGLSKTKSLRIENLGETPQTAYFKAENYTQIGNLANVLFITVTKGQTVLYGGVNSKTLTNFWVEGEIPLLKIPDTSSVDLELTINMATWSGNIFQSQRAQFDLIIGFSESEDEVSVKSVLSEDDEVKGILAEDELPVTKGTIPYKKVVLFSLALASSAKLLSLLRQIIYRYRFKRLK